MGLRRIHQEDRRPCVQVEEHDGRDFERAVDRARTTKQPRDTYRPWAKWPDAAHVGNFLRGHWHSKTYRITLVPKGWLYQAEEQESHLATMLCMLYNIIMVMQVRSVPDELHRQLKILCAEEGVSMNKKVIELIRKEVELKRKGKS